MHVLSNTAHMPSFFLLPVLETLCFYTILQLSFSTKLNICIRSYGYICLLMQPKRQQLDVSYPPIPPTNLTHTLHIVLYSTFSYRSMLLLLFYVFCLFFFLIFLLLFMVFWFLFAHTLIL